MAPPPPVLPDACMYLVKLTNEIKVYHWLTRVFARHEGTDKLLGELQPSVDKFVEMYLVSNNDNKRASPPDSITKLELRTVTDANYTQFLNEAVATLTTGSVGKSIQKNVALGALRDSMLEYLQVALYLAQMK